MCVSVVGRYSVAGRVGRSGAAATVWVSESVVVCKAGGGVGGSVAVGVTGGVRVGSVSGALSYDAVTGSSVGVRNVDGAGSGSVSVSGAGLGSSRYVEKEKERTW